MLLEVSRQGEFPSNFTDGFHSQAITFSLFDPSLIFEQHPQVHNLNVVSLEGVLCCWNVLCQDIEFFGALRPVLLGECCAEVRDAWLL